MQAAPIDPRYTGPATLVLADGRVFRGMGFGARATRVGEIVFNTSMSGYQEIISDPSYTGQMVCLTVSEIGNVGTTRDDDESNMGGACGLLVRSLSPCVSNWRSEQTLHDYLVGRDIPGIAEFDTRALTSHLREQGAIMGALSTENDDVEALLAMARQAPPMEGRDLVGEVSTKAPFEWTEPTWGVSNPPPMDLHVVAFDFGIKRNILRMMRDQGIRVTVVPATTSAAQALSYNPDGIFLSNGPGDPAALESVIGQVRELLNDRPKLCVFGICLGHQLLCLALGGKTYKMKFGHHGGNHPVIDERTKRVAITAQNHGFAVDVHSMGANAELTHRNLFDDTVAGFRLKDAPVSGVQFHPEASPGPHDAAEHLVAFASRLRAAKNLA
jgi:carbamoyl-phosphate synthase small subunit